MRVVYAEKVAGDTVRTDHVENPVAGDSKPENDDCFAFAVWGLEHQQRYRYHATTSNLCQNRADGTDCASKNLSASKLRLEIAMRMARSVRLQDLVATEINHI